MKTMLEEIYNTYGKFLQKLLGEKTYKVSIDGGFTCPNRDGTKGFGGCIFCDEKGSSSRTNPEKTSLKDQIINNIKVRKTRYGAKKFIVYFQSFTNTYAPLKKLKELYDEAVNASKDIVGISISTRPDCVDEEKVQLIASYKKSLPFVSLEFGLQSAHERTLKLINRNETPEDFIKAVRLAKKYNIHICAHVILGLPGETLTDMLETADMLSKLKVDGVKIHALAALENTKISSMYEKGLWQPLSLNEYIEYSLSFIERLHKSCIIHRVSASGHPLHLVAPLWMKEKNLEIAKKLKEEFKKKKSHQGIFCKY